MQSLYRRARQLTRTTTPDNPNSTFIGGFRFADIPTAIDDLMRIWLIHYNNKMNRFLFIRRFIEPFFIKDRFITFEEYQSIFDDKITQPLRHADPKNRSKLLDDIRTRYPIFRLLDITGEEQRQRFILAYNNDLDSYFHLMKEKNPFLRQQFHIWHDTAIKNNERERHTYITGGTGSGKSELMKSLLLSDIIANHSAVVVIDPNGDLAEQIVRFKEHLRKERKDKLVYFEPDLSNPCTPIINPFDISDKSEKSIDIMSQELERAFSQIFESEGGDFTLQMRSILNPTIATVLRMDNGSIWELQRFMNDKVNQDLIELGLKSPNNAHRQFFQDVFCNDNYRLSKAGIYTKIQSLLNSTTFTKLITGKSTIDLKKEIEAKNLIVISLSKGKLGDKTAKYYGKILVALLQGMAFQRANLPQENRTPTHLYIDEFQDFINKSIEDILVQGRKYKIFLTVASQIVGQGMTAEMKKIILSNTNIKIVGKNGYETLQVMSKEIDSPIEELKKLETGKFMVKVGTSATPFVLTASKRALDNSNAMSSEQWQQLKNEIIKKYYVPIPKTPTDLKREENLSSPYSLPPEVKNEPHNQNANEDKPKTQRTDKPKFITKYNRHDSNKTNRGENH